MKIFTPITAQEWQEIRKKGFLRFYLDFVVSTAIIGIAVFAVVDYLVNYGQQTELMTTGMISCAIVALSGGVFMWLFLKRKFAKAGNFQQPG
ncbi:MAG: hypothetical protein WDZ76_06820 [Pseudohongiellaceae bacterium]